MNPSVTLRTVWACPRSVRAIMLASSLLGASPVLRAVTCEELRSSIEERIRANGVQTFSVRVVDASASAPGRVVGSCDGGARKVVYARPDSGTVPTAAPIPSARVASRREVIITECRDGRVLTSGSCAK